MLPECANNFRPVVLAPTYNNGRSLSDVLSRIAVQGLPIIVVNDGSTDSTHDLLRSWSQCHSFVPLETIRHATNRGKAAALQTGFRAAMEAGYSHIITLDTDGQHDPEEIPKLLAASQRNPSAYVLGYRDDTAPQYPAGSRLGRNVSNFLLLLESGVRVRDSQCGMRVYPLDLVQIVRCQAGHFGFETEIIARAAWVGCPFVEIPIVTRYQPPGQRVSHFRPWLDSARAIGMHARLFSLALLPLPRPKYQKSTFAVARRQPLRTRLWRWFNPLHAWRELRRGNISRTEISAALAVGAFIGMLPAYGLQTVISLYTARRLHLHPLAVVTGSHVSIPPVAPFLIGAAVALGHLILHGQLPTWPLISSAHAVRNVAGSLLLDWAVGGVLIGGVLAVVTFLLAQFFLASIYRGELNGADSRTEVESESNTRWAFESEQSMQAGR